MPLCTELPLFRNKTSLDFHLIFEANKGTLKKEAPFPVLIAGTSLRTYRSVTCPRNSQGTWERNGFPKT